MSPQVPSSQVAQTRTMDAEEFEAERTAWLDDDTAAGLPEDEHRHGPGIGYYAIERAVAEANSHETCQPGNQPAGLLVRIDGIDEAITVQRIPPTANINCVLGALARDEEVLGIQVLGWDPEDVEVTEEHGVTVTSEVPGLVATFDGELPEGPKERLLQAIFEPTETRARSPWRYALVAGAVLLASWRIWKGVVNHT